MAVLLSAEELIDIYRKGDRGSRVRFGHQVKKLSFDSKKRVFKTLGLNDNGKKPTVSARQKRKDHPGANNGSARIYWTDEEWDQIAEIVFTLRLNDPIPHLSQLVDRAQRQLPPGRQRKITGMIQCREILPRLKKMKEAATVQLESIPGLRTRISQLNSTPDREQLLTSLDEEEVLRRFKQRVLSLITPEEIAETFGQDLLLNLMPLEDVAAAAIKGAIGLYRDGRAEFNQFLDMDYGDGAKLELKVKRRETARCLIIGITQAECANIRERLKVSAQVTSAESYSDQLALDGYHIIMVWLARSNKAVRQTLAENCKTQRVVGHAGGFSWLVRKLDKTLREEGFSN